MIAIIKRFLKEHRERREYSLGMDCADFLIQDVEQDPKNLKKLANESLDLRDPFTQGFLDKCNSYIKDN
jgi:hypothetical protein